MEFDWGDAFYGDFRLRHTVQWQPFPHPDPPGTLDVRELTVDRVLEAAESCGLPDSWIVVQRLREARAGGQGSKTLADTLSSMRLEGCNRAFRNLVIGRLAEDLFLGSCLEPLRAAGYTIKDYRGVYENRDFGLVKDGHELPINVKVAGTRFLQSKATVGLETDDCIPISSYKAVGAADPNLGRVPDLIFVHLVEFDLRQRVDQFMVDRTGNDQIVWQLLSWYSGRGVKQAQDQFVQSLFERHGADLMALSDGPKNFRVISAKKVLSVMDQNKGRVTQIGVKSGQFTGDPIIHVSRTEETIAWQAMATLLRREGLLSVLRGIRRTQRRSSSDPAL